MNTWPNRGGLRRPLRGGWEIENLNPRTVRPCRSDSSQQASSIPGAVHSAFESHSERLVLNAANQPLDGPLSPGA